MQHNTYGISVEDILHAAMPVLLGTHNYNFLFLTDISIEYIDQRMQDISLNGWVEHRDHTEHVGVPWPSPGPTAFLPATPPRSQTVPLPQHVRTFAAYSRYGCGKLAPVDDC
jgi:hypothetical protein